MMRFLVTSACLAALLWPGAVQASEPSPLDTAAPVVWALAGYEMAVTTGFVASMIDPPCEAFGCVEYGLRWAMIGLGVGAASAGLFGALEASAHFPFAYHHFATGLGSGFAAGLFTARAAGADFLTATLVGLSVGTVTGGGMLTYAIARGDALIQSRSASAPVHLMTWGPFLLSHLTLALVFAEENFDLDMLILSQALPLLIYAITIPWAESQIEDEPPAASMSILRTAPTPMLTVGAAF